MKKVSDLHQEWLKRPGYKAAYDALEEEFQIARTLIEARNRAGLSQTEVAKRMATSQSYIARLESGQVRPSTDALMRFAHSTGSRLRISFEPLGKPKEIAKRIFAKPRRLAKKRA